MGSVPMFLGSVPMFHMFQDVFFAEGDRVRYLELLGAYASEHGLAVQAYCLMSDHVHLVVVPRGEASLAGVLKPLHMRYTQHVNAVQRLSGRLWRSAGFSSAVEETAGGTRRSEARQAGGAATAEAAMTKGGQAPKTEPVPVSPPPLPLDVDRPDDWLATVNRPQTDAELAALRRCLSRGSPFGSDRWVRRIAQTLGLESTLRPRGHPRKEPEK